jgi:hypothetical protein
MIRKVALLKIKMRKKNQESENLLPKPISLKERLKKLCPNERVRKLMD